MTEGRTTPRWRALLETLATAAVLVASLFIISSYVRRSFKQPEPQTGLSAITPATIAISGSPMLGREDAGLGLVMFSDFECQFCQVFSEETLPSFRADYIDTGRVALIFKHYPADGSHQHARRLAELAACASVQGKFWPVHDLFFMPHTKPEDITADRVALQLALEADVLRACLPTDGNRLVGSDVLQGRNLQVTGTPAFFLGRINGRHVTATVKISGARDTGVFREAVSRVVAR